MQGIPLGVPPGRREPDPEADGFGPPSDEPLPDRMDPFGEALISPDDPLPERRAEMSDAFEDAHAAAVGEGEVVGMNLDAQRHPRETVSGGDPHVGQTETGHSLGGPLGALLSWSGSGKLLWRRA